MKILGIETSCDDTSAALVEASDNGFVVLSEKTASQIEVHKKYGGVVPEIAGRQHAENILPVIEEVMKDQDKPEVIAVTAGPGLMTGLLIGVEAAKTLSYLWEVPLVAVNHIEGHIHSVLLDPPFPRGGGHEVPGGLGEVNFPGLCLTVSGGHTQLILINDFGDYKKIGETRDDAAGECFDKVGKLIGLDYPGGPKISKLAESGDPEAINFPRPMINEDNFDFSFSGLKTAALYWLQDNAPKKPIGYELLAMNLNNFCASFEQAIIDVLVTKTIKAAKKHNPKTIILAGGVSANKKLRENFQKTSKTVNCELLAANPKYSMDNAAMIATAAYTHAKKQEFTSWKDIEADPNWKLTE